jgi:sugar transferase (PEP-CTERM/EpsH1 system associated)
MKILVLTPQLPYPPRQGTSIRNYNLIKYLALSHEVSLLSFVQPGDELAGIEHLRGLCRRVEVIEAPRRWPLQRFLVLAFSMQPDMALRLSSAEFRDRLTEMLREDSPDVVQVEGIELAQYGLITDRQHRPLLIFDDHNAEYVLQQRAFEIDLRQPTRWSAAFYSFVQWQKLRRYEALTCRRADRVVAVSKADAEALRRIAPGLEVVVVPNGVDIELYKPFGLEPVRAKPLKSQISNRIVFTGKMDFRPNVDAALWFCNEVLPLISAEVPDAHIDIVGQSPHSRLRPLAANPRITLTGRVPDDRPYIARAAVYVVPLRVGGGTRLKVLSAMAMGKAIVSTTLGCEGIPIAPGREAVLADTPIDFAREVVALLRDPERREAMGRAARRLAEERFDWRKIIPLLERVY